MSVEEHQFCRNYLAKIMVEVRKVVKPETIKHAWAYKYDDGKNIEFQINKCEEVPEGFFWLGRGCCLWLAKADGWKTFIEKRSENAQSTNHNSTKI